MSVSIEDVLSLLPELFPGEQQILLNHIRPNPKNPGKRLTLPETQALADNIARTGLKNAIKVRPDRTNPLAPGVQLHPDNPRLAVSTVEPLRGDGKPWALDDFNWEILAGENRYRAFGLLTRDRIPGYILNPNRQEANEIMWVDNITRDRGWWAAYQAIEMEIEANPDLTMQEVAVNLMIHKDKVSRALRLLPLLGPKTRDLLIRVSDHENQGILDLGEMVTAQLGALNPESVKKPGWNLKAKAEGQEPLKLWPYPPIPSETQELVHRALVEAGKRDMTEKKMKGFVAHIKAGGEPEAYGKAVGSSQSADHSKTPVGSSQSAVDSKQNDQKAKQLKGAGSPKEPALPKPGPGLEGQPKAKDALDGLKKAGKEAKEELKAKAAKVKAGTPPGQKPQLKHSLAILGHYLWVGAKLAFKCLEHVVKWVVKRVHHDCSYLAKQLFPHRGKTGFFKNLFRLLGQRVAYLVLTLVAYGLPLGLIASLFGGWHWIYATGMSLAHLLCVQIPLWAVNGLLHSPWISFFFFVFVYVALFKAFKPGLWSGLFLAVLLFAVWLLRGMWMPLIPMAVNFVDEHAMTGTANPTQSRQDAKNDQGLGNSQSPTTTTETTIPPRRREATKLIKGSTSNPALSLTIGPALSQSKGSKLLTPNSSKPAPNYLPSHAWTSADEDRDTVETELAALPDGPALIKDFPVEVDTSMQPDMAGTRTQDLTDHDRYTVRIGRDKKDIQAVVPGSSTLVLGFSKGLLGNLTDPLGGGNNGVKIIWEDIQAIHCYEWDGMGEHPRKIYVCALLVPEKVPVIVQCGSPTDMAHFVSALEFWIRNARHGTGVPLGGLPYIHQGVLLNDGCDEKAVWENSPMGQAGLLAGDRLWSVDANTYGRQSRDALVKSLDSLAPGQHNLFVVASKDWDRARRSEDFHSEAPFNPARRVVVLTVP
jgi:ParB-like chromosome segregation protein Spo0J